MKKQRYPGGVAIYGQATAIEGTSYSASGSKFSSRSSSTYSCGTSSTVCIPNYTDWAQLDRALYEDQKVENAFIHRFRGCNDWDLPPDNRGLAEKTWQAIID